MFLLAYLTAQVGQEESTLLSPFVYAGIAAAVLIALAFVVWSYRDAANRHTNTRSRVGNQGSGHH
jgi:heme/copper-type cytochrome/quinol oxidase subunit 2